MRLTLATTAVVMAVVIAVTVRGGRCDTDGDVGWVRLCTMTGNGGSRLNVTMPCGVRVESDTAVDDRVDGVDYREQVVDDRPQMNGEMVDETDGGLPDPEDGDGVTVDDDNDDNNDEGADDKLDGQETLMKRPGGEVTELMVAYLVDARNRLYNKIHYLLDLLQQAFFAAKLNRRRRRDSVQRPAHVSDSVSASRRVNNDRSPSITSVIMKPTFERSLMTMSFLMFGVFVIRVMQRLTQTLQQSGGNTSSAPGGILSAAISGIL